FWWFGEAAVASCREAPIRQPASGAFAQGGFYVMQNGRDHVFVDCGPVGLAGRGGHGHNDCLSFEAVLDGIKLITDCGSYVYTASYLDRNLFRSTAYHNTPQVDDQEINRYISPMHLWNLRYDAVPEVRTWEAGSVEDIFCGTHAGYRRLPEPVTLVRTIRLDHRRHGLSIKDEFQGSGRHTIRIPLHLALGVKAWSQGEGLIELQAQDRRFVLKWEDPQRWKLRISEGRVSPSYGRLTAAVRLCWEYAGELGPAFVVEIGPNQ
ncbi:MAG: heparinase II/III family protein, partial [Candidatus Saccharimonadales bacterium]